MILNMLIGVLCEVVGAVGATEKEKGSVMLAKFALADHFAEAPLRLIVR